MPDDRPTLPFGVLNPVERQLIGRHLDPRNTKATDIIRETARDVFKKDTLTNSGAFKGIVLRIEDNPSSEEPTGWISTIFGSKERKVALRTLKIRIPEIHAALPDPSKYGKNAEGSHKIIDMHPTFIAATQDVSDLSVAVGDIVFCDFANRENLTHPVYLGPVFNGPSPGAVGKQSTRKIFENENKSRLCADRPIGDTMLDVKNITNQLPINKPCDSNPNQLNNANNRSNVNRANEFAHDKGNPLGGMPPMRLVEDKWKRGQNLGQIELIEIMPPFASKSGVFIAKDQSEPFFAMREAAKRDGIDIILNSGFRSFDQQKYLYDGFKSGLSGFNLAARPGWSGHQSGNTFDIANTRGGTSPTYVWLSKNSHIFGFINSGRFFKKQREAWHWAYFDPNDERVIAEGRLSVREKQKVFLV